MTITSSLPKTIAELRFSYLENYNFQDPLSDGFDMSTINSNWGAIPGISGIPVYSLPALAIQGYSVGPNLSQLHWNNNVWAFNGSFTKIIGRHSIKVWRQLAPSALGSISG